MTQGSTFTIKAQLALDGRGPRMEGDLLVQPAIRGVQRAELTLKTPLQTLNGRGATLAVAYQDLIPKLKPLHFELISPIIEPAMLRLGDGYQCEGTFILQYQASNWVQLTLYFADKQMVAAADDFFEALCKIRRKLEFGNIIIMCNGSSKNIYPTDMSRDISYGLKATKYLDSNQTVQVDLFGIPNKMDFTPATVEEQKEYILEWHASQHPLLKPS